MARKGILTPETGTETRRREAPPQPRGAVGALQSSLTRLQENAVQDVDPTLIDDAGLEDRLGEDYQAFTKLKDSLKTYGQQVPVLLRPHPTQARRYEIVYGRRRLKALKELGMPVKAMVRHLDDQALVMAQGQENTARQDLSFIEKASFTAQLEASGYDRQTISDALSIDLPMVSRMLKVGKAFDLPFLRMIGAAPGIGRDRWMAFAALLEKPGALSAVKAFLQGPGTTGLSSDDIFEAAFQRARQKVQAKPPAPAKPRTLRAADGAALADIRTTRKGLTLNVPSRGTGDFGAWLNEQAERVMQDLHARWQKERAEEAE